MCTAPGHSSGASLCLNDSSPGAIPLERFSIAADQATFLSQITHRNVSIRESNAICVGACHSPRVFTLAEYKWYGSGLFQKEAGIFWRDLFSLHRTVQFFGRESTLEYHPKEARPGA